MGTVMWGVNRNRFAVQSMINTNINCGGNKQIGDKLLVIIGPRKSNLVAFAFGSPSSSECYRFKRLLEQA